MKVQELRKLLGASERADLEKSFVECYKQLRKGQKEDIDPLLTAILTGKETEQKSGGSPVDFLELEHQINEFIVNANAQNYFAPNRIIPKSQRPKWRFIVKNFIKELSKIPSDSDNYEKSVKLLADLYSLICEACNVYLFSTDICERIFQRKYFANAAFCDNRRIKQGISVYTSGNGIAQRVKDK